MLYVKADNENILPYGEEVQRRHTSFMPLDLSAVVLGIGVGAVINNTPQHFKRLHKILKNFFRHFFQFGNSTEFTYIISHLLFFVKYLYIIFIYALNTTV